MWQHHAPKSSPAADQVKSVNSNISERVRLMRPDEVYVRLDFIQNAELKSPEQVQREYFCHQYMSLLCTVVQWKTVDEQGCETLRSQTYMFCSDDKKHDGVFAAHALKYLAEKVIPKPDRVADSWRRLTIASDNGPHFAQSFSMYALTKIELPSSVCEVRYSFDCPYHGKDCCDPEGGCCKRRISTLQMADLKAFQVAKQAFDALAADEQWTRVNVQRPKHTGPLGLFIERRVAVWVSKDDLQKERAAQPKSLSSLVGMRSAYGVRFAPVREQNPMVETSRFMCFCEGCNQLPRAACRFPLLTQPVSKTKFKVDRVPAATIAQLKAYIHARASHLPVGGTRPVLVQRVAQVLVLKGEFGSSPLPTDADDLLQAVTKKLASFIIEWQGRCDKEAAEQTELEHQARIQAAAGRDRRAAAHQASAAAHQASAGSASVTSAQTLPLSSGPQIRLLTSVGPQSASMESTEVAGTATTERKAATTLPIAPVPPRKRAATAAAHVPLAKKPRLKARFCWIQCGQPRCRKWREVSHDIMANFESQPFECDDLLGFSCSSPCEGDCQQTGRCSCPESDQATQDE